MYDFSTKLVKTRVHGVMVSTLDSESSDPSSNLGGTSLFCRFLISGLLYAVRGIPLLRNSHVTTSMETQATGKVAVSTAVIAQLGER